MKRFVLVTTIPTPYRAVLYNLLHELGREYDIEFSVAFQALREPHRVWKPTDFDLRFPHYYSTGWRDRGKPVELYRYRNWNSDILRDLRRKQYDYVMISPYNATTNWVVARMDLGRAMRLIWSESNLRSTRYMAAPFRAFKSFLLAKFDVLVLPGQRALEYLTTIRPQVHSKPIIWFPNIVDNRLFVETVRDLRTRRAAVRSELGILTDTTLLLGVGQLAERKGFQYLIEAVGRTPGKYQFVHLGDGELQTALQQRIAELGIGDRARLCGPVAEREVARYLAAADWFIHPATGDPSPLVVIEACNAGLPLAISTQTGNSPEAVEEGVNGYTFDPTQPRSIDSCLQKMIALSDSERAAFGAASADIAAQRFEPTRVVRNFYERLLTYSSALGQTARSGAAPVAS